MSRDWNISFRSYFPCPSQQQCLSNELMHCSSYLLLKLYHFLAIKLALFLGTCTDGNILSYGCKNDGWLHMCVDMDVLLCVFVKCSTSLCLLDKTLAVFTKEYCVAPPQALGVLPSSPKANNWNGNEGTSELRSASESNETSHYFKIKTHTANVLYWIQGVLKKCLGKGSIFLPLDSCVQIT